MRLFEPSLSGLYISARILAGFLLVCCLYPDEARAQNTTGTGPIGGESGLREFLARGLTEKPALIVHGHVDLTLNHISGSGAGSSSFRVFDPPGPLANALRFDPTLSSKLNGSGRKDGVNRENFRIGNTITPQALLRLRAGMAQNGWAFGAAGRFEFNADQEFDQELRDSAASLQKIDDIVTQAILFAEKENTLQLSIGIQDPRPLFYSLVTSGEAGYLDYPEPFLAARMVVDLSRHFVLTLAHDWQKEATVISPAFRKRVGEGLFVARVRLRQADKDPTPTFRGVERRIATTIHAAGLLYKSPRWRFAANSFRRTGRKGAIVDIRETGAGLAYRVFKKFEMSLEAGRRDVRKSGLNTFDGGGGPPSFAITTVADANVWMDLQKGQNDWIGVGWDYDINSNWEFTGGVKLEHHDYSDPAIADRKRLTMTSAIRYKF